MAPLPMGTVSVSGAFGQDEAADMLAQMAGHADQLPCQEDGPAQDRIGGVEPGLVRVPPSISCPQLPQTVLASAPVTSSDSPMTLPTSRMTERGR